MEKRILFSAGLLFLLGDLFALLPAVSGGGAAAAAAFSLILAAFVSCFCFKGKRKRAAVLLLFVLIFSFPAGFFRGLLSLRQERGIEAFVGDREQFHIRGKVEKKTEKNGYIELCLKDCVSEEGEKLGRISLASDRELPIGTMTTFSVSKGKIRERRNDGGFDERTYLRSKGIFLKLRNPDFEKVAVPAFSFGEFFYGIRQRIAAFYERNLPGEEPSVLSAMVLGDKSGMDTEVKDLFSAAGIAHLLAVSGLHISLVAMSVYKLLRKLKLSFAVSAAGAIPAAFFYCQLTGASVSGMRAFLMFAIYLLSQVLGEEYDMLTAIGVAALIILLRNPLAVFDTGFVFSFGAVTVVAAAAGPVGTAFDQYLRYRHRTVHGWEPSLSERLASSVLSSAVVCFGTLPLVASVYYIVPTYQIFLNVLLIPLMSVLLPTALIAGITSLPFLLFPSHLIIWFYEFMADRSLKLPFSRIVTGKPSLFRIALYYLFFALLIKCLLLLFEALRRAEDRANTHPARKKAYLKYLPAACGLTVLLLLDIRTAPEKTFSFTMVDVGQGDGLYLSAPDGTQIFIDGGSTDEKNVGKYTLLPFLRSRGIGTVDYWFISHTDADHLNGAVEAMEDGMRVRHLVFAEGVVRNENFESLLAAASSCGAEISYMKKGDRLVCGKKEPLVLSCLYAGSSDYEGDTNANCLALWMEYENLAIPLWGDLGEEQEERILSDRWARSVVEGGAATIGTGGPVSGKNGRIVALKCNHHGSKGSNCEDFLDALAPALALASAGEDNSYGHPNKETKERLADRDIPLYCTIECGEIDLAMEEGKVNVRCPYRKDNSK